MNKLILLALVVISIAACGQKGPLIVDQPVDANGKTTDATTSSNDTATRIDGQIDGQPSIIYR